MDVDQRTSKGYPSHRRNSSDGLRALSNRLDSPSRVFLGDSAGCYSPKVTQRSDPRLRDAAWFIEILDAMTEMVLVKGDRSKLLWANRAFLQYYGITNEALQELIDAEHSDPDDTIQYVKDDHAVFTTGRTLDVRSEPITNAAGQVSFFRTIKSAIKGPHGQVVRTVGVSRAIEQEEIVARSKRARAEQKESISELRALVAHLPIAVAMFDVRQRFLCASEAWRSTLGYEGPELVGAFYDRDFEAQLPLQALMERAVQQREPQRLQSQGLVGGRGSLVINVEVHPWFLPTSEAGGSMVLIHDITEMVASQRKLEQLNDELNQFNYRVSHDLVAPLRTIRGYLNICNDELDTNPEMVRGMHNKMIENVDRLTQLVMNVLNLARSDLKTEDERPMGIQQQNAMMERILSTQQSAIEQSNIKVKVELNLEDLITSEVRLEQILDNLVSNAIKYHDPEEAQRYVEVTGTSIEGAHRIWVKDNGIGIDPEFKDRIFDIFIRGSSNHAGNGLGLYIVKKHVDVMGGSVTLINHRKDTMFELTLPASRAAI